MPAKIDSVFNGDMDKSRQKTLWLTTFIALVLIMIGIGGGTRLTRSGLSITEWRPITGIVPPLNEQDWTAQFEMYKKTPEFLQINSHFELSDYKKIFLWEYAHRAFGRVIFLFTLISGLWLWRKKILCGRLVLTLTGMIALQGLAGWFMVKSGLQTLPRVSPYLLALHYFLALTVLVIAYFHISKERTPISIAFTPWTKLLWQLLGVTLTLQIFYGCLTSGMKAGFAFNTYPLMGNSFLPPAGMSLTPWWLNFFENPITVQWIHRWTGMTAFFLVLLVYFFVGQNVSKKGPFRHLLGITSTQVVLGVLTLVQGVPTLMAVLHQIIAALIVLAFLNISFRAEGIRDEINFFSKFARVFLGSSSNPNSRKIFGLEN